LASILVFGFGLSMARILYLKMKLHPSLPSTIQPIFLRTCSISWFSPHCPGALARLLVFTSAQKLPFACLQMQQQESSCTSSLLASSQDPLQISCNSRIHYKEQYTRILLQSFLLTCTIFPALLSPVASLIAQTSFNPPVLLQSSTTTQSLLTFVIACSSLLPS
jgi:hypothetical protein